MKIFFFGNEIISSDSLPTQLIPDISKQFPEIQFIQADPTENWYRDEKELVIIDTVVGIEKVTVFNSLDSFEQQTRVTPHDYDLYMDLQLLIKAGKVRKITIIGIPPKHSIHIFHQIANTLSKL